MEKNKKITGTATWTAVSDPLYYVECPHCKNTIFMSSPSLLERMKKWAKALVKSEPR